MRGGRSSPQYTISMTTYFLLDDNLTPIPIGDDLVRWIHWHAHARHLCLIGDDLLPDGSRMLTWFYGRDEVLWESLLFDQTGQITSRQYYETFQAALMGHLCVTGVLQ